MPNLAPAAPYDSLATVTQLVRTILADYIQGINPVVSGVVNSNGTAVTWVAGNPFTYLLNGVALTIGGTPYPVLTVNSPTSLTLGSSAGVQNGVAYLGNIPTGDIFADAQAYVVPTINMAWRNLQTRLADRGFSRLQSEIDIFSVPVITNLDPISQQYLSWTGFFDGTNLQNSPTLPADFISPLRMWERATGMTVSMAPMVPAGDGLPSTTKGSYNRNFDWRNDALYFPGSLLPMDFRIRYVKALADLVVGTGQTFDQVPVPILGAGQPLAYYTAAIFVLPRGGVALAPAYNGQGDGATQQMINGWAKLQQRSSFHRRAWGERGRRSYFGR